MSGSQGPLPPKAANSGQFGFVQPTASSPAYLEDDALDDFMQQVVAGITGLPPQLVRPLWQPEPPNLPDFGTDWVAVGLIEARLTPWSYRTHDPSNGGSDVEETWEYLTYLVSFYGPNAGRYDGLLRDGLFLPQNQEAFFLQSIGLVEWETRAVVPVLIKEKWWRKFDRFITLYRSIKRVYPINNLNGAYVRVNVEFGDGEMATENVLSPPPGS